MAKFNRPPRPSVKDGDSFELVIDGDTIKTGLAWEDALRRAEQAVKNGRGFVAVVRIRNDAMKGMASWENGELQ